MDTYIKKFVKIRKQHTCFCCARNYAPGAIMYFQQNYNAGVIYSIYMCKTCQELIYSYGSMFTVSGFEPLFTENCVLEVLKNIIYKGQTPEDLLEILKAQTLEVNKLLKTFKY